MLTLHGRAYHRIFDLQQDHSKVCHNARPYIYDSEFIVTAENLQVNIETASTLRHHIQTKVKWAQEYKPALDNVINSPQPENVPSSSPAFIEFQQTSRVNSGPIIGQEIAALEIAALLYTSGQQCTPPRAVITYPKYSPDGVPRMNLCIQFSGLQQRLASRRSITQASPNDQPDILLPASFHGSPYEA